MKKTLLISGSNRDGNTEYILEMLNKEIKNSELILLKDKQIEYCKGCLACHNIDRCIIKDDINKIIDELIDCDLIVCGVPNYFDNVSGLFKNFMDRLHPLYKSKQLLNKKIVFIYVGGGEFGGKEGTIEKLHISTAGFIKYLGLDLKEEFGFKALNIEDVKMQNDKITEISNKIKTFL